MIGKLIGAAAGAQAAKHSRNIDGPAGAVLGAIAVPLIARMSLPALAVLGGGAYLAKRVMDKRKATSPQPAGPKPAV